MIQATKPVLLFAAVAAMAPAADAQMLELREARKQARNFRQLEVPADQVEANIQTVLKRLRWHNNLQGALQSARNQGKPVLWIQALGDLDGFL